MDRAGAAGEFLSFDHVDLFVRDLRSAVGFFTGQLGLEIVGEAEDHAFLKLGDQVLGLRRLAHGGEPSRPHHVALRVRDLDALARSIASRGGRIARRQERPTYRSVYLEGPDGMEIELVDRPHPDVFSCEHGAGPHAGGGTASATATRAL